MKKIIGKNCSKKTIFTLYSSYSYTRQPELTYRKIIFANVNIILLSCCILLTLLLISGCKEKKAEPKPPVERLVKTVVLKESISGYSRNYPGTVVASKKVNLAFQVNGPLIEFPVVDGQQVEKDKVLARIDPRDYKNRLDAENANLLKESQQYARAEELIKSGTISKSHYDEARSRYDIARAKTATAQKAYDDTFLKAPFSGLVAETLVENFQDVRAKEAILSLQDISAVDIEVDLPEQDLVRAERRDPQNTATSEYDLIVDFGALPGKEYPVTLKEYATQADPITQTYKITMTMAAPKDINILPGMTATLTISSKNYKKPGQFLLPVTAVATDEQGKRYVWLLNEKDMTAKKHYVEVGDLRRDQIRILKGLKKKDRIIVAGVSYLTDGMKVRIQEGKKLVR